MRSRPGTRPHDGSYERIAGGQRPRIAYEPDFLLSIRIPVMVFIDEPPDRHIPDRFGADIRDDRVD